MKAAKEEWTEEQWKKTEKGMMSYISLKAFPKTQQHKSAVTEDSCASVLTESTAVLYR